MKVTKLVLNLAIIFVILQFCVMMFINVSYANSIVDDVFEKGKQFDSNGSNEAEDIIEKTGLSSVGEEILNTVRAGASAVLMAGIAFTGIALAWKDVPGKNKAVVKMWLAILCIVLLVFIFLPEIINFIFDTAEQLKSMA